MLVILMSGLQFWLHSGGKGATLPHATVESESESCRSAAIFLLDVEMEEDLLGRMEVEVDALMVVEMDLYFNSNDSNQCHLLQ